MFSEKDANFTGITGTKDENQIFVNDFTQTTSIEMNCKVVFPPFSVHEDNGFVLDSQFVFIVFGGRNQLPLLIGKLIGQAKYYIGKQTNCEIPYVHNGNVYDANFDKEIPSGDTVDVESQVIVQCNDDYELQIFQRNHFMTCESYGWDGLFPECQSNN